MSRWIEDPQGREEVEKVTRFLKLPVWKPQYLGKFREFWNELWEKIDTNAESSALTLSGKEDSFLKNTAFNKDFGVAREQVLEGAKLAEILGIQYGGLLNNNTTKKRGLGYYCTVNESIYKCKEDTQLNYAESNYFDAISNDDLLGKLQNLYTSKDFYSNFAYRDDNNNFKIFTRIITNLTANEERVVDNLPFTDMNSYIAVPLLWGTASLDPGANPSIVCNQISGNTCVVRTSYAYSYISSRILFIGI